MENKFEMLKDCLMQKQLVPELIDLKEENDGMGFLLGALAQIDEEHKAKRELDTIITAIERTDKKPNEKYFLLLLECQKHYYKLEKIVEEKVTNAPIMNFHHSGFVDMKYDLSAILSFGRDDFVDKELNSPVAKDEIAFVQLYLASKETLDDNKIKPLLLDVAQGKKTIEEASKDIANFALDAYRQPNLSKEKQQQLIRIIISEKAKVSSPEEYERIRASAEMSARCISLEDRVLYIARIRTDQHYKPYRDSLREFVDRKKEPRAHQSDEMNNVLDQLVQEANQLYLDDKESQSVKLQCCELLNQLGEFKNDIGKIRSVQNFRPSPLFDGMTNKEHKRANTPPNHDVKALAKSVNEQATAIEQSINTLSKDTSSLRWGRILVLAIVTLGIGLLAVNSSLNKGGASFFRRDHPVVNHAREIIQQGKVDIKSAVSPEAKQDITDTAHVKLEF